MKINVAIPTYKGENCIGKTLIRLLQAEKHSRFEINRVIADYKPANDRTDKIIKDICGQYNTKAIVYRGNRNLPESRMYLIDKVETDVFLFLDDDVLLHPFTLYYLSEAWSNLSGGMQVRKERQSGKNSKYVKGRVERGTLFCTLLRKEALDGIHIPSECTVLEDEWIRQYVEEMGYLWQFNHQSIISHDNQGRHGIGYKEGYLAGKYDLLEYDYVLLHPFYAMLTGRNPIPHTKRAIGYLRGLL